LTTIPGVVELLALTVASKIGDIAPFPARKLLGHPGLTPRIKQSGQSERVRRPSKAGPNTLRWAAVEAAQQARRPRHRRYPDIKPRHGTSNPAKAALAPRAP
jgi:transposase